MQILITVEKKLIVTLSTTNNIGYATTVITLMLENYVFFNMSYTIIISLPFEPNFEIYKLTIYF